MATVLALVIGGLFAAGFYSILRRSMIRIVIGLMFLSHAANLLIFTSSGIVRGNPPLLKAMGTIPQTYADPLPQALTLTAIVISFGLTAFTLVLLLSVYKTSKTSDTHDMRGSAE